MKYTVKKQDSKNYKYMTSFIDFKELKQKSAARQERIMGKILQDLKETGFCFTTSTFDAESIKQALKEELVFKYFEKGGCEISVVHFFPTHEQFKAVMKKDFSRLLNEKRDEIENNMLLLKNEISIKFKDAPVTVDQICITAETPVIFGKEEIVTEWHFDYIRSSIKTWLNEKGFENVKVGGNRFSSPICVRVEINYDLRPICNKIMKEGITLETQEPILVKKIVENTKDTVEEVEIVTDKKKGWFW